MITPLSFLTPNAFTPAPVIEPVIMPVLVRVVMVLFALFTLIPKAESFAATPEIVPELVRVVMVEVRSKRTPIALLVPADAEIVPELVRVVMTEVLDK